MNFRWSNICVLQCLVVLNVNGLKLVPGDRTVIKQNGTTRTISRYYLLPQNEDETQVNTVDSSASADGDFSKFLREFNPKRKIIKTKRRPPPRKKTIERYRIYIKRKLRKPKKKVVSKPVPKDKTVPEPTMPSDGQPVTKIVKKRRPITYPTDTSDNSTAPPSISYIDSEEDVTGNKNDTEVEESPQHKEKEIPKEDDADPDPTEIIESEVPKPKDPEDIENTDNVENPERVEEDEPVLRTKDSGYSAVEENVKDERADQNFSDIVPDTTAPTNNKNGEEKQPISPEDALTNSDGNYVGPTEVERVIPIHNRETTPSEGIGIGETPPEPLRAEVHMPEVTTIARTLIDNDVMPEDTTQNFDNATTDTIFHSGLTTNEYSKTVRSPPSKGNSQESTEYFDNITNLDYNQALDNQANMTVNPIYEEYILTTTEPTETSTRPVHKLYNVASTEYSEAAANNFTTEYYNQEYENKYFPGINQTDFEFPKNNESSTYNGYNISRTEFPNYNQEGFEYLETTTSYQSLTDSLSDYVTYTEHSKNANGPTFGNYNTQDKQNEIMNPFYLGNNKTGMEYTQHSPENLGEYQTGSKYANNIVTPVYTEFNQVNTGQPLNLSLKEYNQKYYPEYSQTIKYPPSYGNNQAGGEYTESIKKFSFNIGFTGQPESIKNNEDFDINRGPSSLNQEVIKNSESVTRPFYMTYNQPSTEHAKTVRSPIYMENNYDSETKSPPQQLLTQETTEYSKTTKYPSYLSYSQENYEYSRTVRNPAFVGYYQENSEYKDNVKNNLGLNQVSNGQSGIMKTSYSSGSGFNTTGTGKEYSKYINKSQYTGHSTGTLQNIPSYAGYNQSNNGNSEAVVTPHTGQASAEYSTYTKYPDNTTGTDNEYSKYINKPQYTGYGTEALQNMPSYAGYNQLNNGKSEAVVTPHTGEASAEYSTYMKYPDNTTGTDNEYSKYTGHGTESLQNLSSYAIYKQSNNENSEAVVTPHLNHTSAQYSMNTKYPSQTAEYDEYKYSPTAKNMPYSSDDDTSTEHEKSIKSPPIIGYYQESSEYKENIKHNPAFDFDLGGMEYSEPITNATHLVINKPIEKYSKSVIKPPIIGKHHASNTVEEMKYSPYSSHQQSHIYKYSEESRFPAHGVQHQWQYFEYPKNLKSPPFGIHQQSHSVEFSQNSKYPLYGVHPSLQSGEKTRIVSNGVYQQSPIIEYSESLKNPSHTIHLQPHDVEYSDKSKFSHLSAQLPPSGYAEISIKPPYSGNSQLPNGEISRDPHSDAQDNSQDVEYNENSRTVPNTDYADITTNVPPVLSADYMPTVRSIAYPTTTEISHKQNQSEDDQKQPEMAGNANIIKIGNGQEPINHLVNLDSITQIKDKVSAGQEENVPLAELLKAFSNMKVQNENSHSNPEGTSKEGLQINTVVGLLKQLQNYQHPQPIHSNSYKDEDMHKILEYILKGDAEAASFNVKAKTVPSIQLFTVENLNRVLQSFDALKLSEIDKETANLYNIMKLILETAQMQTGTSNEGDALWYKQLPFAVGNSVKNYVYNLLQQTWLQEIMSQLANNDYNLNVIKNPRWAAYLGAWHFPVQFTNGNTQYYDQDDYMLQYLHEHGADVYNKLSDLQGDASAIFLLLQKYLLNSADFLKEGSIDYYVRQHAVLKRIATFLRERGYPLYVIDALIRKLYAVLNSPSRTNVMQESQPHLCLAGH